MFAAAVLAFALAPLEAATPKRDFAAAAWTILPPGENGSLSFDRNTTDQATLYAQGPASSAWRADATVERIRFTSGALPGTMRWTNRPTFQQVMAFSSHRPR